MLTNTGGLRAEDVARRMAFLAYEASSIVGMGVYQMRAGITEEQLCEGQRPGSIYVDYGFGRMMKFNVSYNSDDNVIEFSEHPQSIDYQSWCGKYPTYMDLYLDAIKSLGVTVGR